MRSHPAGNPIAQEQMYAPPVADRPMAPMMQEDAQKSAPPMMMPPSPMGYEAAGRPDPRASSGRPISREAGPPRPSSRGMMDSGMCYGQEEEEEEVFQQKCVAPPMGQSASPMGGNRPILGRQSSQVGATGLSRQASEAGSPQASPTAHMPPSQMPPPPVGRRAGAATSEASQGVQKSVMQGGRAAPKPPPLKGNPEDVKQLLRDLQAAKPRKNPGEISPGRAQKAPIEVPPTAEDDFEKQLQKVSHLTDVNKKVDLTGPLNDMIFQDPPEHIQGLALREALREISGKGEELNSASPRPRT